jgi:hypothetical protein
LAAIAFRWFQAFSAGALFHEIKDQKIKLKEEIKKLIEKIDKELVG